jgi:cyclase
MPSEWTRRQAIIRAARAGLGIAAAGRVGAQAPAVIASGAADVPTWRTELRQMAPNVYAYIQGGGPGQLNQGVSNGGFVVGEDHILMLDSLGAPVHAKNFIAAARQSAPGKRIGRVAITHHHGDHIWGLPFMMPAEVIAHEYCRQAMLATSAPGPVWEKREGWAEGGEERKVIAPGVTINDKLTYYYGNTEVQLITNAPAHTWGDIMIYFPQSKVLFAGDIAFHYVAPFCHNAHPSKWIEACDKIIAMDVDVIVPGHGPIGTKRELADMRDYLKLFRTEARKRYDAGMTPGQAAADIKLGKYEQWIGASDRLAMNMVRMYHEFNGTLSPDYDVEGTNKAAAEMKAIREGKR